MKKCEYCNKQFETKVHNKKYCSDECRNKSKYKPYTCRVCGKVKYSKHPNRKYCSNVCQHKEQKKTSYKNLVCSNCGITFSRKVSKIKDVKIVDTNEEVVTVELV